MSIGIHTVNVMAFHFAAQVFVPSADSANIPGLAAHFLIVPVGLAVQAVFPTPGGVGGSEYGFGKLYALLGKPEAFGVLASLAWRVLSWLLGVIGYLVYLRTSPATPAAVDTEPAAVGAD
jgi:uncharacterized membrane protein YbhN (UPF0104 family)